MASNIPQDGFSCIIAEVAAVRAPTNRDTKRTSSDSDDSHLSDLSTVTAYATEVQDGLELFNSAMQLRGHILGMKTMLPPCARSVDLTEQNINIPTHYIISCIG